MRVTMFSVAIVSIVAFASTTRAEIGGVVEDVVDRGGQVVQDIGDPAAITVNQVPVSDVRFQASGYLSGENGWRYKHHNGRWWYWLPSNQWVVWNGNAWVNYVPPTYSYQPGYTSGYYNDGYYPGYRSGYRSNYYGNRYRYNTGYRGNYYNGRHGTGYRGYYGDRGGRQGAAIGAGIGGAIGGSEGAGIGAAIGGSIGSDRDGGNRGGGDRGRGGRGRD